MTSRSKIRTFFNSKRKDFEYIEDIFEFAINVWNTANINGIVPKEDVEKAQSEKQIALEKNNAELDKLCKNICLIVGWSLVITLLMYIITMEISRG